MWQNYGHEFVASLFGPPCSQTAREWRKSCTQVHTWRRLSVLSARPAVTFPAAARLNRLTDTDFCCLLNIGTHACEQLTSVNSLIVFRTKRPSSLHCLRNQLITAINCLSVRQHVYSYARSAINVCIRPELFIDDMLYLGYVRLQ